MQRFENQVVLITGAAGGMGQAIASKFASQGADLMLADNSLDRLKNVKKELHHFKRQIRLSEGDLADSQYCNNLAKHTADEFGRLDIVVNNAGVMRRGAITDTTDEDFEVSFKINVEAPFRICRSAIPILVRGGGGKIVNTASCWGLYPGPDHAIYCTTKAALASLTKCLGRDHAHQNIRVNAVCPNEVDTPMLRTGFEIRGLEPDKAIDILNESVPLGRIAQAEEIADIVVFLASDESSYMCGACVEINGGKAVY